MGTLSTLVDAPLLCTVCRAELLPGSATSDDGSGHRLCTPCVALRDATVCGECNGPRRPSYDLVRVVRAEAPGTTVYGDAIAYCSTCYHFEDLQSVPVSSYSR